MSSAGRASTNFELPAMRRAAATVEKTIETAKLFSSGRSFSPMFSHFQHILIFSNVF